jgi:hypothetical protein
VINSFRLEITEPAEFSPTTFGILSPRHHRRRYDDVFGQCHNKYLTLETRLRRDTDTQMNFYDRWILPPIHDLVTRQAPSKNITAKRRPGRRFYPNCWTSCASSLLRKRAR